MRTRARGSPSWPEPRLRDRIRLRRPVRSPRTSLLRMGRAIRFFEQAVLEYQLGHHLFQRAGFPAQVLDFGRRRRPLRVAGQALLTALEELLRPAVIEVLNDPFTAAQFGDAVFATQTSQHDADLFLRRKLPAGRAPDLLHNLLCRFFHRPGFLSHLRSFNGYDGPEILPSSTHPFCLSGADAGQTSELRHRRRFSSSRSEEDGG